MGQRTLQWLRFARAARDKRKPKTPSEDDNNGNNGNNNNNNNNTVDSSLTIEDAYPLHPPPELPAALNPSAAPIPNPTYFDTLPQPFDPTMRDSDTSGYSSTNSSVPPPPQLSPSPFTSRTRPMRRSRTDNHPTNLTHSSHFSSSPKSAAGPPTLPLSRSSPTRQEARPWDNRPNKPHRIATPSPHLNLPNSTDVNNPASPPFSPTGELPPTFDSSALSFELNQPQHEPASFPPQPPSGSPRHAHLNAAADSAGGPLDTFVPHRPSDRYAQTSTQPAAQSFPLPHVDPTTPDMLPDSDTSTDRPSIDRRGGRGYLKKLAVGPNRLIFRFKSNTHNDAQHPTAPQSQPDEYFGTSQHDKRPHNEETRPGEEVLIRFLRNTLGPKAQNLAVRLMNKTPITSSSGFSYVIHQGSEDSDMEIIRRDLTCGRLYSSGVRLLGGAWCNLLLGDRFAPGAAPRQRHELTYRRSSCTCIVCRLRAAHLMRVESDTRSQSELGSDSESNTISADVLSTMSTQSRTPIHSAMANFVVRYGLPPIRLLTQIGASSSTRELEIGTVVRLNYRASAKLKFTDDVRGLFGHFAYTGPISHEEVYRRVTTIGVHYYLYNKGKKDRKVYIQGQLIRMPVNVGVIKLGTQPMYMPELGATFCLYRRQIMSIYIGEIVLEGNSIGSFINTGIQYYIGFGEERGVCPVYPNKTLGKARKLGINELLLHHHMVDDLEVKCL